MRASMTAELVFDGVEVGHVNILYATCQPPLDCTRTMYLLVQATMIHVVRAV